jgi:hypothetical protein
MILEVQVLGSLEWQQIYPQFEEMGFEELADLSWADPETDGELRAYYFNYTKKDNLPFEEFIAFINDIKKIVNAGEGPYIKVSITSNSR